MTTTTDTIIITIITATLLALTLTGCEKSEKSAYEKCMDKPVSNYETAEQILGAIKYCETLQ